MYDCVGDASMTVLSELLGITMVNTGFKSRTACQKSRWVLPLTSCVISWLFHM